MEHLERLGTDELETMMSMLSGHSIEEYNIDDVRVMSSFVDNQLIEIDENTFPSFITGMTTDKFKLFLKLQKTHHTFVSKNPQYYQLLLICIQGLDIEHHLQRNLNEALEALDDDDIKQLNLPEKFYLDFSNACGNIYKMKEKMKTHYFCVCGLKQTHMKVVYIPIPEN